MAHSSATHTPSRDDLITALRLEDRKLFQVACPGYQKPGAKE